MKLYTIERLEPDIAAIDASAYYASTAISLKRIADTQERIADALTTIALNLAEVPSVDDLTPIK